MPHTPLTNSGKEIEEWRKNAHRHIDKLWKEQGWKRSTVYRYLTKIFKKHIHISQADIEMCKTICATNFNYKKRNK